MKRKTKFTRAEKRLVKAMQEQEAFLTLPDPGRHFYDVWTPDPAHWGQRRHLFAVRDTTVQGLVDKGALHQPESSAWLQLTEDAMQLS